jgi:hypothetical protein
MHRGPEALLPPFPLAAAIDASLSGVRQPVLPAAFLTPDLYRLKRMRRWQVRPKFPTANHCHVQIVEAPGGAALHYLK